MIIQHRSYTCVSETRKLVEHKRKARIIAGTAGRGVGTKARERYTRGPSSSTPRKTRKFNGSTNNRLCGSQYRLSSEGIIVRRRLTTSFREPWDSTGKTRYTRVGGPRSWHKILDHRISDRLIRNFIFILYSLFFYFLIRKHLTIVVCM